MKRASKAEQGLGRIGRKLQRFPQAGDTILMSAYCDFDVAFSDPQPSILRVMLQGVNTIGQGVLQLT
jgi:hypothetical protein